MTIVADGGGTVGYGHLGRCVALAEAVGEAVFRPVGDEADTWLAERGAAVAAGPAGRVVVVDRREPTGASSVLEWRAAGSRVCLLDDLGDGRGVADAVIDPPTAADWPPAAGRRLAGFEHALLRREIVSARPLARGHVVVAMGGSDPEGYTAGAAATLARAGVEPLVALGPGYNHPPPEHGSVIAPSDWPGVLAGAAVLVATYGHTLVEAACLGVPAVGVPRPRQRRHAAAFARHGTAVMAEPAGAPAAALELLRDPRRREEMAARGRALVDGRGAERVAAALGELA